METSDDPTRTTSYPEVEGYNFSYKTYSFIAVSGLFSTACQSIKQPEFQSNISIQLLNLPLRFVSLSIKDFMMFWFVCP